MTDRVLVQIDGSADDLAAESRRARREVDETSRKVQAENADVAASYRKVGDQVGYYRDQQGRLRNELGQYVVEGDRANAVTERFGFSLGKANRETGFLSRSMSLIKWPAFIAGAGAATQGVSALGAGVVALTSALGPLAGLLTLYPALLGTLGQVAGTVGLAGISDLTEALAGNEEALKRLTPAGKSFLEQLQALEPEYKRLQSIAQQPLFAGVEKGLDSALKNLPELRGLIGDTASELGRLAAEVGNFLGRDGFGSDLTTIGRGNVELLGDMGDAGLHLADALRHVMVEAQPLLRWLGDGAVEMAKFIEQEAEAGRKTGELGDFFDQTQETAGQFFSILQSLSSVLLDIGQAASPLGEDLLGSLEEGADSLERWAESVEGQRSLADFFENARGPIYEAGRLIRDATDAFFQLADTPGLEHFIRQVRVELLPALVEMTETTTKDFGPALIKLLTEGSELMTNFVGSSGPLTIFVQTLGEGARLLNELIDAVPELGTALATALSGFSIAKLFGIGGGISGLLGAGGAAAAGRSVGLPLGKAIGTSILIGIGASELAKKPESIADALFDIGGAAAAGGAIGGPIGAAAAATIASAIKGAQVGEGLAGDLGVTKQIDPASMFSSREMVNMWAADFQQLRSLVSTSDKEFNQFFRGWSKGMRESGRLTRTQAQELRDLLGVARNLSAREFGFNFGEAIAEDGKIVKSELRDISRNLDDFKGDAKKAVAETVLAMARGWRESGQITRKEFRDIRTEVESSMGKAFKSVDRNSKDIAQVGGENFLELSGTAVDAMSAIGINVNEALSKLGSQEKINFNFTTAAGGGGRLGGSSGTGSTSSGGGESGSYQQGGHVSWALRDGGIVPGNTTGDSWPKMLPQDSFVLNREATRAFGFDRGGMVPTLLEPGERFFYPDEVKRIGLDRLEWMNSQVSRFQEGGRVGMATGGIVPVPGHAGEFANSRIMPALTGFLNRFNLWLSDAYGPGHQSEEHTRYGTAADVGPNSGDWESFGRTALTYAVSQGWTPLYYDGSYGTTALSGHGPNHHAHVTFLTAAEYLAGADPGTVAGGATLDLLSRYILKGPEGGLTSTGQAALDLVRKQANRYLSKQNPVPEVGEMSGIPSGGTLSEQQFLQVAMEALRLTESDTGFAPTADNAQKLLTLAIQESGLNPTSQNDWDSNAAAGIPSGGLMQLIPPNFETYHEPGTANSIFDPLANVAASINYQKDRYGSLVTFSPYARGGRVGPDHSGRDKPKGMPGAGDSHSYTGQPGYQDNITIGIPSGKGWKVTDDWRPSENMLEWAQYAGLFDSTSPFADSAQKRKNGNWDDRHAQFYIGGAHTPWKKLMGEPSKLGKNIDYGPSEWQINKAIEAGVFGTFQDTANRSEIEANVAALLGLTPSAQKNALRGRNPVGASAKTPKINPNRPPDHSDRETPKGMPEAGDSHSYTGQDNYQDNIIIGSPEGKGWSIEWDEWRPSVNMLDAATQAGLWDSTSPFADYSQKRKNGNWDDRHAQFVVGEGDTPWKAMTGEPSEIIDHPDIEYGPSEWSIRQALKAGIFGSFKDPNTPSEVTQAALALLEGKSDLRGDDSASTGKLAYPGMVGASYFDDSQGYKGSLTSGGPWYAELGMEGPPFVDASTARLLGGLPYKYPLDVTFGGKTVRGYKGDVGDGGDDVKGKTRRIDLHEGFAKELGFPYGIDLVDVREAGAGASDADAPSNFKRGSGGIKEIEQILDGLASGQYNKAGAKEAQERLDQLLSRLSRQDRRKYKKELRELKAEGIMAPWAHAINRSLGAEGDASDYLDQLQVDHDLTEMPFSLDDAIVSALGIDPNAITGYSEDGWNALSDGPGGQKQTVIDFMNSAFGREQGELDQEITAGSSLFSNVLGVRNNLLLGLDAAAKRKRSLAADLKKAKDRRDDAQKEVGKLTDQITKKQEQISSAREKSEKAPKGKDGDAIRERQGDRIRRLSAEIQGLNVDLGRAQRKAGFANESIGSLEESDQNVTGRQGEWRGELGEVQGRNAPKGLAPSASSWSADGGAQTSFGMSPQQVIDADFGGRLQAAAADLITMGAERAKMIAAPSFATTPADPDDDNAALVQQLRDEATREELANLRLKIREDSVFEQFFGDLKGLPYLGAFAMGIRRVPETGLAVLHKDEMVTPDPEGPYGTTIPVRGGDGVVVNLFVDGDIAPLMGKVRAEVAGVEARVNTRIGRDMRQRAVAPGR